MHAFVGPDNGVDRAGANALRTTNAKGGIDYDHKSDARHATTQIECDLGLAEDTRQSCDAFLPARRAAVWRGFAVSHRLCIRQACGKAAALALRLRQDSIKLLDKVQTIRLVGSIDEGLALSKNLTVRPQKLSLNWVQTKGSEV